nr:MAG TPA: peptidase [Caudoviricetes sp.]
MLIAIIDSGCFDHILLREKLIYGKNFTSEGNSQNVTDNFGHGTHIAGIIHDIIPEAQLLIIKVLDRYGYGTIDEITQGIYYALDKGANIINISIGYEDPDDELKTAIETAESKNVPVICAAGNDNTISYPAQYGISVGSIDNKGNVSDFSTSKATLYAMGEDVKSTYVNDSYEILTGTSMATAKMTGYIAKYIMDNKDTQIIDFIKQSEGDKS